MSEKYVVRLKNAAIYHADNPFGSTSAEKLMRRGEMVLSDVNLCVAPGEFVYLIGRVGSGKSTLLKTLYAEVQLLTGEGRVAGYDLRRLRRRDIPHLRRRIGIVFQDYQLLTDRNVFMNLYYVMKATGWKREDEIRERIDQVLKLVDLGAKSYKMPFELSGGEQQRLVIARAILNNPQVLLADEPTGDRRPRLCRGHVHAQHRPDRELPCARHPLCAGAYPRGRPQGGTRVADRESRTPQPRPGDVAARPARCGRNALRNVLQMQKIVWRKPCGYCLFGIYFVYLYDILKTTDEYRIRKRKKARRRIFRFEYPGSRRA